MIVIKVELHSARTGKITELARMKVCRVVSRDSGKHDYDAIVMRKPKFDRITRATTVKEHRAAIEPVWTLICSALNQMGYGAPYARLRAKQDNPICAHCSRNTEAPLFSCKLKDCPKGYLDVHQDRQEIDSERARGHSEEV